MAANHAIADAVQTALSALCQSVDTPSVNFQGTIMNQTLFPFFYLPVMNNKAATEMWSRVNEVYQHLWQDTAAQLWTSSARIIQEHTARAIVESSQACMQALLQNAANIQQQALARLVGANQQAAGIVVHEISDTMTAALTAE